MVVTDRELGIEVSKYNRTYSFFPLTFAGTLSGRHFGGTIVGSLPYKRNHKKNVSK